MVPKQMHPDQWFRSEVIISDRAFSRNAAFVLHSFGTATQYLPVYRTEKLVEVELDEFEIGN